MILVVFPGQILPERESEMRSLVVLLESKVKRVILAQHSTKVSCHNASFLKLAAIKFVPMFIYSVLIISL